MRKRHLGLERMEDRALPATFWWTGEVGFLGITKTQADDWSLYIDADGNRGTWDNHPGPTDTVIIDNHQVAPMVVYGNVSLELGELQILANAPNLSGWHAPDPNLEVEGILTIHGGKQDAARIFIHRRPAEDPNGINGILNITGGVFFYSGGNFDSDDDSGDGIDRTGRVFVFGNGEFNDSAVAGKIGASIFIGRDLWGNGSSGAMDISGTTTTFFFDATLGVALQGTLELAADSEIMDTSIVNNLLENYGTTTVSSNNLCEFYVQNYGLVNVFPDKTFSVSGRHTDADGTYAYKQLGGTTKLWGGTGGLYMNSSGYLQKGGTFLCYDAGMDNRQWNVSGPMKFLGGTCQIDSTDNKYGTLICNSTVTFQNANLLFNLDMSTDNHCGKFTAASFVLGAGATVTSQNYNPPPTDMNTHEWQFLVGPVTGTWSAYGKIDYMGAHSTLLVMSPSWQTTVGIYWVRP